ncbi:diguanylate cyclase [Denitromonas iodatirespirans]|uniref:diguanylate cyclase n=1 Tax=Denitromonas iodatirespirans TaxID=2795389 RepID=A0A944DJ78_DENI1|nr:diguanylate cyclase [Denitromonas iodatirespirans]MBT0959839.1 diguanylate cyclase [Denitromonas iodatirespirans]
MDERATILIVDDIPSNIQTLAAVLKDDYTLYFATSGAKALELCLQRPPDLVLLDVMMPGMDGFELCRRIKSEPLTCDVPVIFVTARSDVEDETLGLEAGAIDFVGKPISPPIVRARVRNHLQLKRQADMLRKLSFRDGLTGIANRRAFDEALDRAWRRGARTGTPVSLILLDVDHFKAYNDFYGHQGGDDCLREMAQLMAARAGRPDDLTARYGGEEFACLLPGTDAEGALTVGHSIIDALAERRLPHAASPTAGWITVSVGIASRVPDTADAPATLLAAADAALYQAKAGGRNRLCVSTL